MLWWVHFWGPMNLEAEGRHRGLEAEMPRSQRGSLSDVFYSWARWDGGLAGNGEFARQRWRDDSGETSALEPDFGLEVEGGGGLKNPQSASFQNLNQRLKNARGVSFLDFQPALSVPLSHSGLNNPTHPKLTQTSVACLCNI